MADGPGIAGPAGVVPDTAALQLREQEGVNVKAKKSPKKGNWIELLLPEVKREQERVVLNVLQWSVKDSAEEVLFILSAFSSASVSHILDGF